MKICTKVNVSLKQNIPIIIIVMSYFVQIMMLKFSLVSKKKFFKNKNHVIYYRISSHVKIWI